MRQSFRHFPEGKNLTPFNFQATYEYVEFILYDSSFPQDVV